MKIEKINLDGKKEPIEVLDKIFSGKINKKLVDTILYKTNGNYKGRHAKTKQKNEIIGCIYRHPTMDVKTFNEKYFNEISYNYG